MAEDIILKIENVSKRYRLGLVGRGTIKDDLKSWWYKFRGKEDPFLTVGETNDRTTKGLSEYIWALKDINLEVKKGEVLGIIGANGAGKSTLLKILSKITTPTTGSIKFKGRIASLLEVGTGFHGELTGKENIFLNGAILGMTKAEITSKLDEIIEFSGCERYIDTPVKRYSSGMGVRLGFAVAAFLEPDILIVDEVLAVGDAEFQKKAIGKMKDISSGDNGRTVLFVSHNMNSIRKLCTKGIVLKNGSIVCTGTQMECIDFYLKNTNDKNYSTKYINNNEIDYVKRIEVKSDQNIFYTGDKLSFYFYLKNFIKENFFIGVGVYNNLDEKILHLSSKDLKGFVKDKNNLICELDKNPLIEGSYYINVVLFFENGKVEKYNECLCFNVYNGDFFKTNKVPRIENIKVFVDQNWID